MSNQYSPFQKEQPDDPGRRKSKQGFVPPRQVEDHWQFYRKGLYVARPGRNLPAWLIPLAALLLIIVLVFWAVPTAITRIQNALNAGQDASQDQASLLYDLSTWTVNRSVADVFDRDDLKAGRVTQALFNEPVTILPAGCTYGFVKVRLTDGLEGYMRSTDLVDSRQSIEPDLFINKLVIASPTKRVMSHASRGTLVVEVTMGTVLFADYRGDGISRVRLPDGSEGWISDEGVIVLPPLGQIQPAAAGARYFCTTALAFNQVTVLPNGQSVRGISTAGIARLSAAVNGINLPRSLQGQSQSGTLVPLAQDETTGMIKLETLQAGDLVFLAAQGDKSATPQPVDMAIYMGSGQILYARVNQSAIRLTDLTQNTDLWQRIIQARRLFA